MSEIRYADTRDAEYAACALLCGVEYAASAVLLFDTAGACCDAYLFDTAYGDVRRPLPSCAQHAWLISNHPEGRKTLYDRDRRHIAALRELLGAGHVRFFLAGEMLPCREMDAEMGD